MSRQPYFEIVRRDDGWLARFRGANGHKVFTSELYTRREAAEHALELIAEAVDPETAGVAWREVDERTADDDERAS